MSTNTDSMCMCACACSSAGRWQRWLDDDSSWPDFSVVVHGDLYVGHVLIDNTERVSGMIDWSEARVDDPAIDMAAHLMVFGEEGLAKLLLTYEAAGGSDGPAPGYPPGPVPVPDVP